jgi:hypothetical protein
MGRSLMNEITAGLANQTRRTLRASRLAVLGLAILVQSGIASAQELKNVPAPDTHAATGLTFPPVIADAIIVRSIDYGASGRPDLGYSWSYNAPGRLAATVYLYTLNQPSIASGAASPEVAAEVDNAVRDIYRAAEATKDRYADLQTVAGPASCTIGTLIFRCATLSAINVKAQYRLFTAVMVTGYRNHFLKLRIDWKQDATGQAAKDAFLQALFTKVVP